MIELEVVAVEQQTADIRAYRLADRKGGMLPGFEAGAHVDIVTPSGLVRQYSLCSSPAVRHEYAIAVKNEPSSRGGSRSMHDVVSPGHRLTVGQPRNAFSLHKGDEGAVLIAGGIGLTPLLSMAQQLAATKRNFHLCYFARAAHQVAFRSTLDSLAKHGQIEIFSGLGREETRERLHEKLCTVGDSAQVYLCGPAPFMQAAKDAAGHLLRPGQLHWETFSADALAVEGQDRPVNLVLARSNISLVVPPNVSIAHALMEKGIAVPLSCEQGICGTCLTAVLDGIPDHRDQYLMDDEKSEHKVMAICVSRACSARLVLDL